jgi:hypothetical protein
MIAINNLKKIMQLGTIMSKKQKNLANMTVSVNHNNNKHILNEIHSPNINKNYSHWCRLNFSFSTKKPNNEFSK